MYSFSFQQFRDMDLDDAIKNFTTALLNAYMQEVSKNVDSPEYSLRREYLDNIMDQGHCVKKHGIGDIDGLIDRLINKPPTTDGVGGKVSAFRSVGDTYFKMDDMLKYHADKIVSWLFTDGISNRDVLSLTSKFSVDEDYKDVGVDFKSGMVRFIETNSITMVVRPDTENELNDFHCIIKTAYPDISTGDINRDESIKQTKLFYKRLLTHPNETLRQAWSLSLKGVNYKIYSKDFYAEDNWAKKCIQKEYPVTFRNGKESKLIASFLSRGTTFFANNGTQNVSFTRDKIPKSVLRDVQKTEDILRNADDIIKNAYMDFQIQSSPQSIFSMPNNFVSQNLVDISVIEGSVDDNSNTPDITLNETAIDDKR